MYYQNYEDYMRNVLGYPNPNQEPTYQFQNDFYPEINTEDEQLYPEIYRIIYPMVCKICDEKEGMPLTNQLLEEMTNTIYSNIEPEIEEEVPEKREVLKNGDVRNPNVKIQEPQTRQRVPNRTLQDLIRILLLRELFQRRRPNPRPPFPGGPGMGPGPRPPMPPRPPFPGGPGMGPGPRPPMPRDYNNLYY